MRKYLLGVLAIILAIFFSAFKKPNAVHRFVFDSSKGSIFSQSDVDNISNWTDNDYIVEACESQPEIQDRACTIEVHENYYELKPDGEGELRLKTSGSNVIDLTIINGLLHSGSTFYQLVAEATTENAHPAGAIEVINANVP